MPEFYHLCSLDIVANRQLLHLWLNRFAEVSTGFQSKSFPEMIHHPNKHPFIINTYPYLIYIYISYISHCQSEGNHPVSVEMFERKMLKKLYQKLSNEHSDGLGCLHFKVRGH